MAITVRPSVPTSHASESEHRRQLANTVNLLNQTTPDSSDTEAELEAGVRIISRAYPPGDPRRIKPVVNGEVKINIPSDVETLQDAIDLFPLRVPGVTTVLNIESGHRLTAGLRLVGGDYSHFIIKSEDPVVYLASGFVPVDSSPVPESSRAIFYFESCIAPVLGCLIDGEGVSSHDGLIAYRNAHVNVAPGAGVVGTRMNCEVRNGRIHAKNTVWSRARRGCMRLTDNTQFTISGSEFSDSWTHPPDGTSPTSAAVHISRSSIGQAQNLLIERSGLAAITVRRSRVYLDGTTINVVGLAGIGSSNIPIRPQMGATIVLGDVVFNGNPITPEQCQVEAFNVPHAQGIVYANGHPATLHSIVRTGSENAVSFSRALRVKQILLPDFSLNDPDVTLSLGGEFAAGSFTAAYVSVAGTAWMAGTGYTARLRAVNALVVGATGNTVRIRMHDPANNATDQTVNLLVTVIGRPAEDS